MSRFTRRMIAAGLAIMLATGVASAADPVRIGVLFAFSGPFTSAGKQVETAIRLFQEDRGTSVAGRQVEFILRDTTGPAPDVAVRLATELITRDHVDILSGLDFTPNAMAVAGVSNRAGTPAVSMNASGLAFLKVAKLGVRLSFTLPQQVVPLADWAAKNGISRVYSIVAGFAPGIEAEEAFTKAFKDHGGTMVGAVRVPLSNPDFSPYLQRVRDAHPDAVFVFLPAGGGDLPAAFFRAFAEAGLAKMGIKVIGTGATDESTMDAIGDSALGVVTAFHYSSAHDSPANLNFVRRFEAATGGQLRPTFTAAQAYDTLTAIYRAIEAQNGRVTAQGTIEALRGMTFEGLRGSVSIDQTGEIVQTIYIREVRKVDGRLQNIEFDSYPAIGGLGYPQAK